VVRNLADSSERTIGDVVESLLAEDGNQLVYAVGARLGEEWGLRGETGERRWAGALAAGKANTPSSPGMKTRRGSLPQRPRRCGRKAAEVEAYRWERQSRRPACW
jgi:hypothetical protein